MYFDQGTLELMAPSFDHERLNRLLAELVAAIATGLDLDYEQAGSTTFKREDISRGFEPDPVFYLEHVAAIRGHRRIDLATDPPPIWCWRLILPIPRWISSRSMPRLGYRKSGGMMPNASSCIDSPQTGMRVWR